MLNKFFLGIGPPKTATTWLYNALKQHPDIDLTPVKGLKFDWEAPDTQLHTLYSSLFRKSYFLNNKRKKLNRILQQNWSKFREHGAIDWKELKWAVRFFRGGTGVDWYFKLFEKDQLAGDITPNYCVLSDSVVQRIHDYVPNAKIIISLRDPIERDWSQAKMHFTRDQTYKSMEAVPQEDVLNFLNRHHRVRISDYAAIVERWEQVFSKNQVLIYYFEEVQRDPDVLFKKVCTFLEINPISLSNLREKKNAGLEDQILEPYLQRLIELNRPLMLKMSDMLDSPYPKLWLEKYAISDMLAEKE